MDGTNTQRRPTHPGVLLVGRQTPARLISEGSHNLAHLRNGVNALIGLRAVSCYPVGVATPTDGSFVRHDNVQFGGLRDNGGIWQAR